MELCGISLCVSSLLFTILIRIRPLFLASLLATIVKLRNRRVRWISVHSLQLIKIKEREKKEYIKSPLAERIHLFLHPGAVASAAFFFSFFSVSNNISYGSRCWKVLASFPSESNAKNKICKITQDQEVVRLTESIVFIIFILDWGGGVMGG